MNLPRSFGLAAITAVAGVACSDGGSQPSSVPTTVSVTPATATLAALGATQQLQASVRDQNGNAMSGVAVTWSSTDPAVASVGTTGLVTALANGSTQVTATAGSATGSAAVTVAQQASAIVRGSGDGQSAPVTQPLPSPIVAVVRDASGSPVQGATVTFSASQGGGVVTPTSAVTDAAGEASTQWTFGTLAGAHTVVASAAGRNTPFAGTALADVPDSMFVAEGPTVATVGAPVTISVGVVDQYGNPAPELSVSFTPGANSGTVSPNPAVSDTDGRAVTTWTLGPDEGLQTLEAQAGGVKGSPAVFGLTAVAALPASIEVAAGEGQIGLTGDPINIPPSVLVRDGAGRPFAGAGVSFAVTGGTGTVTGTTVTTDAEGLAEVGSWILGSGANSLSATVAGSGITGNPVTFNAMGQSAAFTIELVFVGGSDPQYEGAFRDAKTRWQDAIFGDLEDVLLTWPLPRPPNDTTPPDTICSGVNPGTFTDRPVDDVLIFVDLKSIDGPNGIVGRAGPCVIQVPSGRPVMGGMVFDIADLDNLDQLGLLDEVAVHEMGHVLGYGTIWDYLGLLENPSDPDRGGTVGADAHFPGTSAVWAFDRAGGDDYTAGDKVPVENNAAAYGSGSLDSHWRESLFETELMTPTLNAHVTNPLSRVSLASMLDLGFLVTFAAADSYALPGPAALAAASDATIRLIDDVARGPIFAVDRTGRVTRVIRR
jgi:hypothetical protein